MLQYKIYGGVRRISMPRNEIGFEYAKWMSVTCTQLLLSRSCYQMFYINYNDAAGTKPRYKLRSLEPHEQPSDTGTTMALPASKPLDSVAKNKSQSGE